MHLICVSKVLEELKCLFKYSFLSFFVILLDSWHLYWFHYSWSSLWQWQEFCRLFCPSKLLQFLIPNWIVQIWYHQNRRLWTIQRKQRSLHWTFSIHTVFPTIHSLFLGISMIAINTFSISSITWSSPMPNKTVFPFFSLLILDYTFIASGKTQNELSIEMMQRINMNKGFSIPYYLGEYVNENSYGLKVVYPLRDLNQKEVLFYMHYAHIPTTPNPIFFKFSLLSSSSLYLHTFSIFNLLTKWNV